MRNPRINVISGKHPITAKSGYARYASALAKNLTALHYDVHIYCVGKKASITKTPIGIIHEVRVPLIGLVRGREMIALLPASIFMAHAIARQKSSGIVWGIGPWSLTGAWVKREKSSVLFFADYFTTIRHEYHLLPLTIEAFLAKLILIPLYAYYESLLLTRCNTILTHYQSSERIIIHEFGLSPKKLYRLPYAIF